MCFLQKDAAPTQQSSFKFRTELVSFARPVKYNLRSL